MKYTKRKHRTVNKMGRNDAEARYIQIPFWVMETEAYRHLSGNDTKVLQYVVKRYNGYNNGQIGFGSRSGCMVPQKGTGALENSSIGLSPSSVSRSLRNLERFGFTRCMKEATFNQKRLTQEWRLTWLRCDVTGDLPTKEFASLSAEQCKHLKSKPSAKDDTVVPFTVPSVTQHTSILDRIWHLQSHGRLYANVS